MPQAQTSPFDTDHLVPTYFKMTIPAVTGMVVTLIYNLADTYFIAQTGVTELIAGVSLCSPVFTTLMAFGNIFGQGGSSLISRLLGQNDRGGIRRASAFCFYAALAVGAAACALMLLFQNQLLALLGAEGDVLPHARDYYLVLAIGAPLVVLNFVPYNLVRCEGLASQGTIASVMGSVLNIILDPIFISVLHMGAAGAAIATVLGYLLTDLYLLFVLRTKCHYLSTDPRACAVPPAYLQQIFGVGVTAAITNLMQSLCVLLVNQFLVPYGSSRVAAMGIALKINMIAQLALTGFAFGAVPLFGYLYGADNRQKLADLIRFCLQFLGGLALALSALIFGGASWLMRAFVSDGAIVAEGSVMLRWLVVSTVCVAVVLLVTVLFQATGQVLPALAMSLSRQGVLFIAVLFIAVQLAGYQGLLAAQAIADLASAALGLALYWRVLGSRTQSTGAAG